VPRLSSEATGGEDALEAHGDHIEGGDQGDACGLSLPGRAVSRIAADASECGGGCAGVALVHLWGRHGAAGGTTASEGTPDRR